MATIKAVIRKSQGKTKVNQQGETLIYVQYGHDQKAFTVNTGVRISPAAWRGNKDQMNPVGGEVKGRTGKNQIIAQHRRQLEGIVSELLHNGLEPTVDAVKTKIDGNVSQPTESDVFALWQDYINTSEDTKTHSTVKQIKRARNVFRDYWQQRRQRPTLEKLNIDFYHDYVKFLLNKRGMNNNSAGKEIKILKSFLNYLSLKGFAISSDVARFKVFKEKVPIIFLTQAELNQLCEHDFGANTRLSRVRDLFVFQASTGLRWSDISRLSGEHIQDGIIYMTAYKNKKEVMVPLTPRARGILEKYGGKLPIIAEQNVNLYIKEACRLAGIDQMIERVTYRGGKKIFEHVPKCAKISTHVAIKTFITHCGQKGISAKIVSEITGKTTKVILDCYYGTDKKTIISEMARAFGGV